MKRNLLVDRRLSAAASVCLRSLFRILREHYAGSGKPRVITLYNQLTTLKKSNSETMTDYILRAETAAYALKTAEEHVSDALLVALVLKGLPDDYKAFVAVVTQSDTVQNFQKFNPIQAGVVCYYIAWGHNVHPSISPLFVVQLLPNWQNSSLGQNLSKAVKVKSIMTSL